MLKLALILAAIWWLTRPRPVSAAVRGKVDEGEGFSVYIPGGGDAFDPSSINARQPGTP